MKKQDDDTSNILKNNYLKYKKNPLKPRGETMALEQDRFKLHSEYSMTGDQPQAVEKLVSGIRKGLKHQTLMGVTGSGKTFTMANIIEQVNRPTLIISHNKTLAAQLYGEFKEFFPENAVEYFVS